MQRAYALLLIVVLVSCTVQRQPQKRPVTIFKPEHVLELGTGVVLEGPTIATGEVEYGTVDGKILKGFIAIPIGDGPFPALVLLHDLWGLNDAMRRNAQAFAQNGYVALVADLHNGEVTTDAARGRVLANAAKANKENVFNNLEQAIEFLRADPMVDRTAVGSVGWGTGGTWSYELAKQDLETRVHVLYYGAFDTNPSGVKAPVLGHFGEQDDTISLEDVLEFREKLRLLATGHEVYVYPGAGHGFASNDTGAFDPAAADVAWDRTLDFLENRLGEVR